jgi:tRNA1(Val) A37 N6-methylase TrmN6
MKLSAIMTPDTREKEAEVAAHGFLGGRLQLRQPLRGHRAGTDAVLLAAATPPQTSGLILDVGAGVGAVGLAAAMFAPGASVGLVEIDAATCALSLDNVDDNRLAGRVSVHEADVVDAASRRSAGLVDERAELVLTNPPFLKEGSARASPDEKRALAHIGKTCLASWTRACLALLRPGGTFVMIHRADALAKCLSSVEGRLGSIAVLPVLPRAGEAATRILLRGVKGSKGSLTLLSPLVLHEADGRFTETAEAVNRGQARLFES